jgi:hypothetical protein
MDQEPVNDSMSGLLKLNLVLGRLTSSDKSLDDVLKDLSRASTFLSSILRLRDTETAHFFVVYTILELLAILVNENEMKLSLKNIQSDVRNQLKVSQDAIGYYTGLFRFDELLIPFPEDSDIKSFEQRVRSIVRHSLK